MVRVVICQMTSSQDTSTNLRKIRDTVRTGGGDLYLFPEMFLSGYGAEIPDEKVLEGAIEELRTISILSGSALAVGMPRRDGNTTHNSLAFITPEKTQIYDKIHLANFGRYNEKMFSPGKKPAIVEWKDMRFGLLICYDIMFPELSRYYAVKGADVLLMASASLNPSQRVMKTILPARSLENTVYTVFCNNTGTFVNDRFFGGSAAYLPTGEILNEASDNEEFLTVDLSREVIRIARENRPHLMDRCPDAYFADI